VLQLPLISLAVNSYQQLLQPAGLHASIHPAYGRRSIGHSPPRPETEALSRVRISGITRGGVGSSVFVLGPRVSAGYCRITARLVVGRRVGRRAGIAGG